MHCSSCSEKGECWALCHQYSCACITCIYMLVLYFQNSSKASQAPSPWGGNGKWVFSAEYFCLVASGSKRRGSVFVPLKAKDKSWDRCFGNCRYISNMYHVKTVFWATELIILGLVGVRGSHWMNSDPPVSHPVWEGRRSRITPSSVQSPLKSEIRPGGSVLNFLTVYFSSQMKVIKISVNSLASTMSL